MHRFKTTNTKTPSSRTRRSRGGFAFLPVLIIGGIAAAAPLAYLLWPAVVSTVDFVDTVSKTIGVIVNVALWGALVVLAAYLMRLAKRKGVLAKLWETWRGLFS